MRFHFLFILFTLSLVASSSAQAKIARLAKEDITDLAMTDVGKCKGSWGPRIKITIGTASESFVYTYCSSQPLSAYMDQVYPRLREFVNGPDLGSCQIKTYCDSYGGCQYEPGTLETSKHELMLITDEKNQIPAEAFNDIRVNSSTACRPVRCR